MGKKSTKTAHLRSPKLLYVQITCMHAFNRALTSKPKFRDFSQKAWPRKATQSSLPNEGLPSYLRVRGLLLQFTYFWVTDLWVKLVISKGYKMKFKILPPSFKSTKKRTTVTFAECPEMPLVPGSHCTSTVTRQVQGILLKTVHGTKGHIPLILDLKSLNKFLLNYKVLHGILKVIASLR